MSVRPSQKNRPHIPFAPPVTVPERTAAKTMRSAEFIEACKGQGVEPTRRQAARYNAAAGRWSGR
jgi:hypothetical protein